MRALIGAGETWNVGDLALFCDRLVTVLEYSPSSEKIALEFVDEGGRTRVFNVWDGPFVAPIPTDQPLDVIAELTRPHLTSSQQRAREAETWFADPQVGDCFKHGSRLFIAIHAIGPTGRIVCVKTVYNFDASLSLEDCEVLTFLNAESLRCTYQYEERPGYALVACCSPRPYTRFRPLKNHMVVRGDSPLLSVENEIYRESLVK